MTASLIGMAAAPDSLERVLLGALDGDPAVRRSAEAFLAECSGRAGFEAALVNVALRDDYPQGLRHLAAVRARRLRCLKPGDSYAGCSQHHPFYAGHAEKPHTAALVSTSETLPRASCIG